MKLPHHTRAAALVAALATTAAIVNVMAEIGHPPPSGQGMLAWLQGPATPLARVSVAQAPGTQVDPGSPQP
jgi:hypothetical protein